MHVIKHMQTIDYLEAMNFFPISNSSQLRRQIAIDLVLHEGNREKERILSTICPKANVKLLL